MTELVKYEAACLAIAEALAVDEVQNIRDEWKAIEAASRIMKNLDLELRAMQIRFRAERRLGELVIKQRETVGLNRGGRPKKPEVETDSGAESVSVPTLREAGIAPKESMRAQKLARLPAEEFEGLLTKHADEVRAGKTKVATDLLKVDSEERGRTHRRDLASAMASISAQTPSGKMYPAVLADPPWKREGGIGDRAYENHYPTMPWPEILDYLKRAGEALQPNAWAWMWIPRPHLLAKVPYKTEVMLADGECVIATVDLPLAYACQLALGMDSYSTCYVWTKTDEDHPDESGSGLLVWDQDELLLQFKRGRGLPKPASDEKFGSNHRERKREHSRKPDHYRHMIATMVGKDSDDQPLPVLELFARVDGEHPLPENWDAWGNQAGVALQPGGVLVPDDIAEVVLECIHGGLVLQGSIDLPVPSGETEVAAAEATSHGASAAAAASGADRADWDALMAVIQQAPLPDAVVADLLSRGLIFDLKRTPDTPGYPYLPSKAGFAHAEFLKPRFWVEPTNEEIRARFEKKRAPYDADDTIVIDQLAGTEWLAPPFDPASLPECEALKILSDFCHPRRDIAPALGEFYLPRGFTYRGASEWSLTGKGWDRLRELEAIEAPSAPRIELTAPRAQASTLFDFARQIDQAPAPEIVDGALQTRLPVDDDELSEQIALLEISAGRFACVDPDMMRHLVGRGLAHCTAERVLVTDEGRAFLAQLATPASVQQQGAHNVD